MSDMYDRFGKPIESNEWSRLIEKCAIIRAVILNSEDRNDREVINF